jgi:hypothetical protein
MFLKFIINISVTASAEYTHELPDLANSIFVSPDKLPWGKVNVIFSNVASPPAELKLLLPRLSHFIGFGLSVFGPVGLSEHEEEIRKKVKGIANKKIIHRFKACICQLH